MGDVDRDFWEDAFRQTPDQVMVVDRILDQELQDLAVGRALDLGCGSGDNALKLAQRGWSVVGIDWAPTAIDLATESAREKGLDATFHVADITKWGPPALFDLVISIYALPGGEDSKRVLDMAMQALSPGGTLLIAEWDKAMADLWGFAEDELSSPEEIVGLLPGLEIEKAEVRNLKDLFASPGDPRAFYGSEAMVAVVRARKPPANGKGQRKRDEE
jgi:SAM-dependent methyltransferase